MMAEELNARIDSLELAVKALAESVFKAKPFGGKQAPPFGKKDSGDGDKDSDGDSDKEELGAEPPPVVNIDTEHDRATENSQSAPT